MPGRNCILGLAAGYHYGDVRPFLVSLERAGYQDDCVLFVSETTRDLERMKEHKVSVIPLKRAADLQHISYNALRYFLYQDFLNRQDSPYEHILMTDVRDVIFQFDPFEFSWSEGLNCTLEDERMTIGQCPHNSQWVRGHLGTQALDDIKDAPISCSGTTVGSHAATIEYLTTMTNELRSYEPAERMAGYDQGVHNHLLHTDKLNNVTLHDNSGPILTLGYTQGEPPTDSEGRVLNTTGNPAHIVHQYDRKPALFKTLRTQYG